MQRKTSGAGLQSMAGNSTGMFVGIALHLRGERSAYFDNNNPLQSLLELETKEKIETLIETMPEKCHKVYKMSRHDFLKNKEIANQLGVSIKMVEKHISKALMILRIGLSE